jgi:UDPglucose 6-dehydrogenase
VGKCVKVGMVGVGKLGLACLLAMEKHGGHEIFGFDINEEVLNKIRNKHVDYFEAGVNDYLLTSKIKVSRDLKEIVTNCDIIFIAVQTPHEIEFEGITPLPLDRRDFSYEYLSAAIDSICAEIDKGVARIPTIVVISTVMPGTIEKVVIPKLNATGQQINFIYNPYFISMGTTIHDFLNPEFLLVGKSSNSDTKILRNTYNFLEVDFVEMSIVSAELAKVAYNSFSGLKLTFVNALMEICEKIDADVDKVTGALLKSNKRLLSGAYMRAGMGDGGACHPRDQIAMSWLAKSIDLSSDIFENVALTRDAQTKWLAKTLAKKSMESKLPIAILGRSFKADLPLTIGSPVLLMEHYLKIQGVAFNSYDPFATEIETFPNYKCVAFLGMNHKVYKQLNLVSGSIVLDPWNFVEEAGEGVEVVRIGRRNQ